MQITPLITSNNGVANFYAAVRIDNETQELFITLFIDTDWQQVVEGQIFIHALEFGPKSVEPIDFSKAINGVYVHEFMFAQEDNLPGYDLSPAIAVTNMTGDPTEVLKKVADVALSGSEVHASIVPVLLSP